ncbi:HTTM domain-containing protein [Flavobacterium sp.]|uniref:HTTM domain-containing protein n=1 Tax=Flavobacterium sp. TaxID=239 RepID=UPI0026310BA9|nr:HTTM domain-containing protein [Flavobacterium sp.]MDD3003671.1 HTTM domain-containing protein [Flavobacterium sp.]
MQKILFKPIDNAPLIIFRIFFGFLLAIESFGAIVTGWVKSVFIEPEFTFSYIGFEWLQPLPGNGMYFYFVLMGICGILVMLGYKYRISLSVFSLMWLGVYLMQKSSYNNHYYLLFLICIIMLLLPANKYASIDAKINPGIKTLSMPQWCSWVMIGQIFIMYFFAALAKFYPDWLNGNFTRILFSNHPFEFLNPLIQNHYFHLFIAYSGILFDFLIIPFFLIKKTRTFAFFSAVFFHLFNAVFLHIGIFPFFALSFIVFCYPPDFIRKLFFKKKPSFDTAIPPASGKKILLWFFVPYFLIQLFLPVRHWLIPHDVVWTEEGHRLSWRMMLRSRNGITNFRIIDKQTNTLIPYDYRARLTPKQQNFVAAYPDGIWQMAQMIKKEFEAKNQDVAVYVDSEVSINQGNYYTFINPEVDLSSVKWNYFLPNDWILIPQDHR